MIKSVKTIMLLKRLSINQIFLEKKKKNKQHRFNIDMVIIIKYF